MTTTRRGAAFAPKPPTRAATAEALVHLYLRLNGYLTSGFIVHSHERGKNLTEVDTVAVRHPHNAEPVRVLKPSGFLEPSAAMIDLLVCEVKRNRQGLQFNDELREDPLALWTVVQWVGLFDGAALERVVPKLRELVKPGCDAAAALAGITEGNVRVRPLLCAPEVVGVQDGDPWFADHGEILGYVHVALTKPRLYSSIRYSLAAWGPWLEPIVTYFKDVVREDGKPDIEALYRFVGATAAK